ncbi:methyltransferase [Pseudobdellovibrio exovorus JSS]|uniref:Methyltransferase n=1 Tax=Pseudobdellovibrio exovorus JSS TaxID=1184267 RepID=M4VA47_9BACT|nr:methyltransferase [Pseudobdellovibrio exovorus JSS]
MDSFLLHKKLPPNFSVLIPFIRFEKELENELLLSGHTIVFKNNKYFIVAPLDKKPIWAQELLSDCQCIEFSNKAHAVKVLKSFDTLGVYFPTDANTKLADSIRKDLRELSLKRIEFKVPSPFNFKYFAWGLLDSSHLIVCQSPSSQFPLGWHEFKEDKAIPPNRAYLKLWEVLSLGYIHLDKSDIAIDLGSSPGGWSWVLSQFVSKVYSVDKAPLSEKIQQQKNILYTSGDAFQIKPTDFADCSWLFSDIICTPERLLGLVHNWIDNSNVQNFVCTIKFKGDCNFDILKEFLQIQDSRIIHLYQNKNEVTWIRQGNKK